MEASYASRLSGNLAPIKLKMESYEELLFRHENEVRELAEQIKVMLKGIKKSNRAQVEAQAVQMNFDLKARHRDEVDDWEATTGKIKSSCLPKFFI
jgi:hypothetical protein